MSADVTSEPDFVTSEFLNNPNRFNATITGANDPQDPVAESDQFVHAARENGCEVEYVRFPDERVY